ncbi:EAL domain-containing protein [Sulfurimonas sp.]|uniref:EAL domain-containing protein n=1 Tax=Sulfurimonas sp. TaxID=2022749 RepID=UPI00260108E7|nr:EAL domain-containing protein [Sulfurimonas sp.]MBW6487558.1 EAL domain-containing protein [Sulfurimonas sp.]
MIGKNKNLTEEDSKSIAISSFGLGFFFGALAYAINDLSLVSTGIISFVLSFLFYNLSTRSNAIRKILLEPKEIFKSTEGLQEKNLTALLKRRTVSDFLEYRAYGEKDGLGYYTMRDGRRGFVFRVHPGAFIGSNVESILTSCLETISVEGAVANFFTFASRNVENKIKEFEEIHLDSNINVAHPDILHDMIRSRARHLRKWTHKSMLKGVDLRIRDFINLVSFSFPKGTPQDKLDSYFAQIKGTLSELHPKEFSGKEMITMVKEILSPEIESWDSPADYSIDMSTQMTSEGTRIRTTTNGEILIGEKWYAKTITTKNFPESISLSEFTGLFYDRFGTSVQNTVPSPFLVSLVISYDNVEETNKKLANIATWNIKETNKLNSTIRDSFPDVQKRAEEARLVTKYQDAGQVPLRAMWTFVIFDDNKSRLDEYYGKAIAQFKKKNWSLIQESFGNIALLSLMATLPLNFNQNVKKLLKRFRVLFLSNNTQIAPLISDASGSRMVIPYFGRSGQLFGFDFYDSDTNYNVVAAGESGSGKSYTQNDIHAMVLAAGYNVRGIDAGHSYKYLNDFIGGQYIEFSDGNDICLNFFTKIIMQRKILTDENGEMVLDENDQPIETDEILQVKDEKGILRSVIHADEYKTIVPIIGQMAGVRLASTTSENSNIINDLTTKFIASSVEGAIQESYWQLGENAGMETVYRALKDTVKELLAKNRNKDAEILSRFIDSISSYCVPQGMFYKYFNGPNNIDFKSAYVIAELDDLKSKGELYNVVLMAFAQTVMAEFFGDRRTPKIFFVDEAWMIFDNMIVVAFLNDLYRRIRKYNGIAITITQGVQDFFLNRMTEAMYNNANWKYFLQIGSDGLEQAVNAKKVYLPEIIVRLMKSIRNNKTLKVGEAMIRSEKMIMVSKLKTDPLSHYTYAGMGPQERPFLEYLAQKYKLSIHDAVRVAALKLENNLEDDEAYKMLKGDSAEMVGEIEEKERLEKMLNTLEDAINTDKVLVYKQKIQSIEEDINEPMYENLIRIEKENKELLSPALFLDDAKKLGIYTSISKIVIDKVFESYENEQEQFSINISICDINNSELSKYIIDKVSSSSASNRFIIEIDVDCGNEVVEDFNTVKDFVKKLKDYNVKIALDGIGIKNADFNQIFAIDVDYIKLNNTLIREIEENTEAYIFAEMLVGFCKKTNIRTVAIHVERESTLELARILGIDYVQGFLVGKPVPLETNKNTLR